MICTKHVLNNMEEEGAKPKLPILAHSPNQCLASQDKSCGFVPCNHVCKERRGGLVLATKLDGS